MMRLLDLVLCFLFDHEEPRRPDADGIPERLPESEPWPCTRCGEDCRPSVVIEIENEDRIERAFIEARKRRL